MVSRTSSNNVTSSSSASPRKPSRKTPQADFSQVTSHSLKKYKKEFKLRMTTGMNKAELAAAVQKHFSSIPAPTNEDLVIDHFLAAVRQQIRENQASSDLGSS